MIRVQKAWAWAGSGEHRQQGPGLQVELGGEGLQVEAREAAI